MVATDNKEVVCPCCVRPNTDEQELQFLESCGEADCVCPWCGTAYVACQEGGSYISWEDSEY